MITALFVESGGPYFEVIGIDPWDESRDARLYDGNQKVIAHPPCQRWGRYWSGGPSAKVRRILGDDDRCFESALKSVRRVGGVIEHPAHSHAFNFFNLGKPPASGGWVKSDDGIGLIAHVEQGHYGHPARKATWLYAVDCKPLELKWGPASGKQRLDEGFHSAAERKAARQSGIKPIKRLSKKQNIHTPTEFRDLLIKLVLNG